MQSLDRTSTPVRPTPGNIVSLLESLPPAAQARQRVKLALVGTYAPRKCGLATFTTDVNTQLIAHNPEFDVAIFALDEPGSEVAYQGVDTLIAQDDPASYFAAARRINQSGAGAVWIQHEFGIFGGPDRGPCRCARSARAISSTGSPPP